MRVSYTVAAIACVLPVRAQLPSLVQLFNTTSDLRKMSLWFSSGPYLTSLASLANITILAPSNDAYDAFLAFYNSPQFARDYSYWDLPSTFYYGVINGSYPTLPNNQFLPTLFYQGGHNVTGGQRLRAFDPTTIGSALLRNSTVASQALTYNGGVVHVLDKFLTVPGQVSKTLTAFNLTAAYGAIQAAKLMQTFETTKDYTIFVPNNAAFQRIGSALTDLTAEQLSAILQYHAFSSNAAPIYLTDKTLGSTYTPTQRGGILSLRNYDNVWWVNNARVIVPNILTTNGVIHIIDQVLNPSNTTQSYISPENPGMPAYSGASSASRVPFTSGVPIPSSTINLGAVYTGTSASDSGSSGSSQSSSQSSNVGAIAGGVVGGIAAVVLIILAIWFWKRKGYSLQLNKVDKTPQPSTNPGSTMVNTNASHKGGEFDEKAELAGSTAVKGVVSRAELSAAERSELEAREKGSAIDRESQVAELEANESTQLKKKPSVQRK